MKNTPISPTLPIDTLQSTFMDALGSRPLVVSSPTGSGKSTQLPRWAASRGPVLVVEPRRVACRSLATYLAHLEGTPLGDGVGYRVRDEERYRPETRILFVTTGIALKLIQRGEIDTFHTVILDEFHERSLDIDLILALLYARLKGSPAFNLVVMSATLAGDALARHLGGLHLRGEGRAFPVKVMHMGDERALPSAKDLEARALQAVKKALQFEGDILIFMPGKGEINALCQRLESQKLEAHLKILPLHGGLSLSEQNRVFSAVDGRKIIVATNVAETSLTVPGIRVVIDGGLARQTHYYNGRGHLALSPIAMDNAIQRQGRAGRLGPGICLRLWGASVRLAERAQPEIFRESLVPLVLAAKACGQSPGQLAFFDTPKAHALEAAADNLRALGALDAEHNLTPQGRALFGLPLDAHLGRLLIEAKGQDGAEDMVYLVAALAVARPLFRPKAPDEAEDDLRRFNCDATAHILALRGGRAKIHGLYPDALAEGRKIAKKLARLLGLSLSKGQESGPLRLSKAQRQNLIHLALKAIPNAAMVARRRKREIAYSAGGTEHHLAKESAIDAEKADAIIAFDSRAFGVGPRGRTLLVTHAMPIGPQKIAEYGLATPEVKKSFIEDGQLMGKIDYLYAKRVVSSQERPLNGGKESQLALKDMLLARRLMSKLAPALEEILATAAHHQRLAAADLAPQSYAEAPFAQDEAIPSPEDWLLAALDDLGVEDYETFTLLEAQDLLPPDLPEALKTPLLRQFPLYLDLGENRYRINYRLQRRQVLLERIAGKGKTWPTLNYLPPFRGFSIAVQHGNVHHDLKRR